MVKGTNRTVIEINDTGNNMFEKVLLFVTPEYGNLNAKQLKNEAQKLIKKYCPEMADTARIRDIYRKRRLIRNICITGVGVLILTLVAILLF